MSQQKEEWSNQDILEYFLRAIVQHINRTALQSVDGIRETARISETNRLKDELVELEGSVVSLIFSFLDANNGPANWPGIMLVNAETREPLSDDLSWEFSRIEGEYIDSIDT